MRCNVGSQRLPKLDKLVFVRLILELPGDSNNKDLLQASFRMRHRLIIFAAAGMHLRGLYYRIIFYLDVSKLIPINIKR